MLDACAPGHTVKEKKHRYWVIYQETIFRGLPKGAHGKPNPEVELGHVKQLIKVLKIASDCARTCLPQLAKWRWEPPK